MNAALSLTEQFTEERGKKKRERKAQSVARAAVSAARNVGLGDRGGWSGELHSGND